MQFPYILDRYFIKQPRLRRLVTSLFEKNRNVDVDIAGAELHINSRREHGYLRASRIIQSNSNLRDEIPVLMNLFNLVRNADTFVDVGANTGLYTHSFSRLTRLYPDFRIIAIEANPDTFSRLSVKQSDQIRYINLAMSDTTGVIEFIDGAVSHVFTSLDKKNSYNIDGETVVVPTKRLDELEINSKSIILKIDVEGQESRVLRGATQLLENGWVKAIYLDGYDDPSIKETLIEYGFELFEGKSLRKIEVHEKPRTLLAIKH